ncbi:GNAT family N-acetyltransferase [Nocardia sp. NBC_01329]|uniref:GNAT family N-acetyltransferase n=1 Tax=Nocardia sp. NBC_01329 TaxID=2903594 RepID=UPI002E100531|nr:GNAT family N-acetyltransferase [Nocardia sp. NBC_01329]
MGTPSAIDMRARGLRLYHVHQEHPLAVALLAELAIDHSIRYGDTAGAIHRRLRDCPATDFAAPDGDLLVLVDHGGPVAGGGFRRGDATTAELKRVWTAREHRRAGLATRVLAELEAEMIRLGYRRVAATVGDRQPEARALYTAAEFAEVASGIARLCRFEKDLGTGARPLGTQSGAAVEVLDRRPG